LTQELSTAGLLRGQDPGKVVELVSFTADLKEAVKDAVYVQECIPEVLQMKKDMFAKVRNSVARHSHTVRTVSTSTPNRAGFALGFQRPKSANSKPVEKAHVCNNT
jgi:L-gulonate 3-dehydrogenase